VNLPTRRAQAAPLALGAFAERPAERLDRLIAGIRGLVTTQPLGPLTGVAIIGEGRHVTPELRDAIVRLAGIGSD
jgi:hypothetical protein